MRSLQEIHPGVHRLGTPMVNWYLVEAEGGLTAVDAGLPGFAATLDDDLRAIGRSVADVEAVVLTHSDGDHTGVVPALRERGARVLIHAADEATLAKPAPKHGDASPRRVIGNLWRPEALRVLIDSLRHGGGRLPRIEGAETFADGDELDVPGRPRVIHTPGHTPGHCALLFPAHGVLFAGDAMLNHTLFTKGRGPRLMPSYTNEDTRQCLASLDRIEHADVRVVTFGHGDPWREGVAGAVALARRAALT